MKVHVVDGTFELFRCFHGAPRHANAAGDEVGAVRGLLHTLLSLLKGPDVSHVAVAFDQLPVPRGASSDPGVLIRRQAGLALDAVRGLGIRLWPMYRFQADDALATAAAKLKHLAEVEQVVVCTTDTDLYQCIDADRVITLDRIRNVTTNEAALRDKLGIRPSLFPDHLALVGATAKGLPGVPGFGRKATATLLSRYDALEAIPLQAECWDVDVRGKARLAEALASRRDEALLVKGLATLHVDLPIDCDLEALRWRALDETLLDRVISRAEAKDLYPRLERWQR